MIKASVKEARQKLSYLLDQVEHGEKVTILRRGHVVAQIVPVTQSVTHKRLPSLKKLRNRISIKGMPLSEMIIKEREEK